MPRARFRRKDLKRPDEFVSRGRDVIEWAQDNVRLVAQVAGALTVVFIGIAAFASMRAARSRQANEDLAHALAEFRGGRYPQAAAQLGEVAGRWASTAPGEIAKLYAAQADLKANNITSAATALKDAATYTELPIYLKQQIALAEAYTYEHDGKFKEAAERYAAAAALDGPYISVAILGEARADEGLGDKAAASKLYDRLLNEFSQIPEIDQIKAKLGRAS
ncbi:MAG: hypothetical protein HY270_03840 [Deltaproteobacteria bacterium]|nr:hypothetical protein [Deltaproteobacteria bacterium]